MNFEKCLCFDGEIMPNSARYYTAHKSKLLGDVSFIKKNNYPKNKLMWLAISNRGMSVPYFRPSKSVAINTEIILTSAYNQGSYHLYTNITGTSTIYFGLI